MLRIGLFGHFCVSGIFPTLEERHQGARARWRHTIDLYKTFVRPMLSTCRVFHHAPVQQHGEQGERCVLEYAAPDASRAYAGIFRLSGSANDTYHFYSRGSDVSRRSRVRFDTLDQICELSGYELRNAGCRVRVPGPLQSELFLFEAI